MRKHSVLSICICAAIGLSACGGGGDDSGSTTLETRTVTAIDGYLKNAVVFANKNGDLTWGSDEPILGVTDSEGKLTFDEYTGSVGVFTVMPNTSLYDRVIAEYAAYTGYTVDMDFPDQPMTNELVLVSPPDIDLISPISHAVSLIASESGLSIEDAAESLKAIAEVSGMPDVDYTSNYISGGNNQQRKLAQLIADGISAGDFATNLEQYIAEAVDVIQDMTDEQLNDPAYRPHIDGDVGTPPTVNNTVMIDSDAVIEFQAYLDDMELTTGDTAVSGEIDLAELEIASDLDTSVLPMLGLSLSPEASGQSSIVTSNGVTIEIEDGIVNLSSDEIVTGADAMFYLIVSDVDQNGDVVETLPLPFTLSSVTENAIPVLNDDAIDSLQTVIDNWQLEKDVSFEYTIDISTLFSDPDGDELVFTASTTISTIGMSVLVANGELTISGTPTALADAGHALKIGASDTLHDEYVYAEFDLPEVFDAGTTEPSPEPEPEPEPEPTGNPLEGKTWYYIQTEDHSIGNYNYCMAVSFENGVYSVTEAGVRDYYGCDTAKDRMIQVGSVVVTDDALLLGQVPFAAHYFTVRYSQDVSGGLAYGVTIDDFRQEDDHSVRMMYTDPVNVTSKLTLQPDSIVSMPYKLYIPEIEEYLDATAIVNIASEGVTISFESSNRVLDCDDLNPLFGYNGASIVGGSQWGFTYSCKDTVISEETGESESSLPYYQFKLGIVEDVDYHIYLEDDGTYYVQPIMLNIHQ